MKSRGRGGDGCGSWMSSVVGCTRPVIDELVGGQVKARREDGSCGGDGGRLCRWMMGAGRDCVDIG